MDWGKLFLSAEGRTGQQDYWIGVLILIAVWIVSHAAHVFAPLIWLLLIYPWVCVLAKRLHDFNRSAWLILIPVIVHFVALAAAFVAGGAALIGAIFASASDRGADVAWNWASVVGALGVALAFLGIGLVVNFVFLLWVGLNRGDPATNRYGPPPGAVTTPPAATA